MKKKFDNGDQTVEIFRILWLVVDVDDLANELVDDAVPEPEIRRTSGFWTEL